MPDPRPRELLVGVARALRTTPGAYALAGVIAAAVAGAVFAPVSSLLARLLVASTGAYVVANTDLVAYFLSLRGLVTLLVAGVAGAMSGQLVGASAVAAHAVESEAGAWAHAGAALRLVASRLGALVALAALKVVGLALRGAPFAAVIGGAVVLAMRGYDMNYFVHERPTPFWIALGVAGVVGLAGAILLAITLAGWALALPACLLDGVSPRAALRESARALAGRRRPVMFAQVAWHLAAGAAAWSTVGAFLLVTRPLLDRPWSSLAGAAAVTGALVVIASSISLCGAVLGSVGTGVMGAMLRRARSPGSTTAVAPEKRRVRRAIVLAGLAALALGVGVSVAVGVFEVSARPLTIAVAAHRGESTHAPENTLAAVELAAKVGCPWIEIDVQITRDGGVILAHDTDLRRIAGGDPRRVADMTLDEITKVDAGSWFDAKFADQRIATLAQAIDAAGEKSGLFIELKVTGDPKPLALATLEVVRAKEFMDRCVFVSLSAEAITAVRAAAPDAPIGLIFSAGVGAPERLGGQKVLLNASHATDSVIARYRRAGTEVYVWTINDPQKLAHLALTGVTGVLTDDPEAMLKEARRLTELPEIELLLLAAREKLRRQHVPRIGSSGPIRAPCVVPDGGNTD